jgi:hypothetical protein
VDDAQVVKVSMSKVYAAVGEEARVEVRLSSLVAPHLPIQRSTSVAGGEGKKSTNSMLGEDEDGVQWITPPPKRKGVVYEVYDDEDEEDDDLFE